jgi:hypothetical protein
LLKNIHDEIDPSWTLTDETSNDARLAQILQQQEQDDDDDDEQQQQLFSSIV